MATPLCWLPEMMLRAAEIVPPMTLELPEETLHARVAVTQGDAPGRVRADEIALDPVFTGGARGGEDVESALGIAGNHIARARHGAANQVPHRAKDGHAIDHVGQRVGAVDFSADEIAADPVVAGEAVVDVEPALAIAGDDVARGDVRAANQIGWPRQENAVVGVAQAGCSGRVRADEVALHHVAARAVPRDVEARLVAGNQVAVRRLGAADAVALPLKNRHARRRVGALDRAVQRGAHVAAGHHVAAALNLDAVAVEAINAQAADFATGGQQTQPVGRAGTGADEPDDRLARVTGLRRPVDGHGLGEGGQGGSRGDVIGGGAGDVEVDRVRAGRIVGVLDGLPQGTRSAVVLVRHDQDRAFCARP